METSHIVRLSKRSVVLEIDAAALVADGMEVTCSPNGSGWSRRSHRGISGCVVPVPEADAAEQRSSEP